MFILQRAASAIVAGVRSTVFHLAAVTSPARRVTLAVRTSVVVVPAVTPEAAVLSGACVDDVTLGTSVWGHALATCLVELVGSHGADAFQAGASVLAGERHSVTSGALVRVAIVTDEGVGADACGYKKERCQKLSQLQNIFTVQY